MANSISWEGAEYVRELEIELAHNLEKAAILLVNEIKQDLNVSEPYHIGNGAKGKHYHGEDPSSPGEPPKKIRGDLQRSITYEMKDKGTSAQVGTNLDYGAALELGSYKLAPRPYLRPALIEHAEKITAIVAGNV